jgi:hypothetical protein
LQNHKETGRHHSQESNYSSLSSGLPSLVETLIPAAEEGSQEKRAELQESNHSIPTSVMPSETPIPAAGKKKSSKRPLPSETPCRGCNFDPFGTGNRSIRAVASGTSSTCTGVSPRSGPKHRCKCSQCAKLDTVIEKTNQHAKRFFNSEKDAPSYVTAEMKQMLYGELPKSEEDLEKHASSLATMIANTKSGNTLGFKLYFLQDLDVGKEIPIDKRQVCFRVTNLPYE